MDDVLAISIFCFVFPFVYSDGYIHPIHLWNRTNSFIDSCVDRRHEKIRVNHPLYPFPLFFALLLLSSAFSSSYIISYISISVRRYSHTKLCTLSKQKANQTTSRQVLGTNRSRNNRQADLSKFISKEWKGGEEG